MSILMPDSFNEFNPNNPYTQLALLAQRVDNLGKEKEAIEQDLRDERAVAVALEKRVAAMEKSFQRGAGVLMVIPIIGTLIGILIAYGGKIFAPWAK